MYKSVTMFFYSGTGNTYRVANWIGEYALTKGINPELVPMNKDHRNIIDESGDDNIIGLLFPTHAFTAPLGAIKFALTMPPGKGRHCFVLATRGGGGITAGTPGCEGSGTWLIAAILKSKGYVVKGVCAVDMPSNWNVVHSSYSSKKIERILANAHDKSWELAEGIFKGDKVYKGIIPAIIGILFLPLSVLYLLIGRQYLSKIFFTNNKCNGCGLCAKNCPNKAIKMIGNKKARPYWSFSCESCMRCMAFCPHKAIEASHLVLILMLAVFYIPFSKRVWIYIEYAFSSVWISAFAGFVLAAAACIVMLYLLHIITNIISRWKIPNMILCITTFTRFFKRYTEPGTEVPDMVKATSQKL